RTPAIISDVEYKSIGPFEVREWLIIDGGYLKPSVDHPHIKAHVAVRNRVDSVIRNIKVQPPVAVIIGNGKRHAPHSEIENILGFGEMPLPVIEEEVGAAANGIDDQIERSVAIDIDQCRSRGIQIRASDAGFFGDVLKFPISQVSIKMVARFGSAKVQVTQAVSIHVAGGYPGAAGKDLTRQGPLLRQ